MTPKEAFYTRIIERHGSFEAAQAHANRQHTLREAVEFIALFSVVGAGMGSLVTFVIIPLINSL